MKMRGLTLKVFFLIVLSDIGESIAQLFLKKGLLHTGMVSVTLGNFSEFFVRGATSPFIWLGLFVFVLNFFIWITILTRVDLSVAFPVGSTSYIFVPLLAAVFLHETITPLRYAGILTIVTGIIFVSRSSHEP